MSLKSLTNLLLAALLALLVGCRGSESKKPPIHIVPNMDLQEKYKAQEEGQFFTDGQTMRPLVEGTIPYGDNNKRHGEDYLKHDSAFHHGKDASGAAVTQLPSLEKLGHDSVQSLLKRGKQRYEIYCTPCHGATGDARGLATSSIREAGLKGVLNFTDKAYADSVPVGKIYNAINKGGAVMPSYAYQIKVRDRWAIVAYVKLLQKAAQDPEFIKTAEANKNKK